MTSHVMIDLETLDSSPTAVIISIGAVKFCPIIGEIHNEGFYRTIDVAPQLKMGRTISGETLKWWMAQEEGARDVFQSKDVVKLPEALTELKEWAARTSYVWGNGSDFDVSMITHAFNMCEIPSPWNFWNHRCFRTMKNIYALGSPCPKREGTHHNALFDAHFQAGHLIEIYKVLNELRTKGVLQTPPLSA